MTFTVNPVDEWSGKRIRLIHMPDDFDPVPPGSEGTILFTSEFNDALCVTVRWDNGRGLNIVSPPDIFVIIDDSILSSEKVIS